MSSALIPLTLYGTLKVCCNSEIIQRIHSPILLLSDAVIIFLEMRKWRIMLLSETVADSEPDEG